MLKQPLIGMSNLGQRRLNFSSHPGSTLPSCGDSGIQPKTPRSNGWYHRRYLRDIRLYLPILFLLISFFQPFKLIASNQAEIEGKLVLTGSSTVAPLVLEIGKRFENLHPKVRIDVQTGGSSRGIADARRGLADIGLASRAATTAEQDLTFSPLAMDGIALIVHRDNPVNTISDKHIVEIFQGKLKNWQELGGKDAPITVVNKAEGRSTLALFTEFFAITNRDIKAHIIIGDNEQGIKTVAGNPNAIGYVSIGTAEFNATQGGSIKLLPLSKVASSVANVRNGSYPLSRPLNFVTKTEPVGLVKVFIEFAQSRGVHDLVEEQFFVPIIR